MPSEWKFHSFPGPKQHNDKLRTTRKSQGIHRYCLVWIHTNLSCCWICCSGRRWLNRRCRRGLLRAYCGIGSHRPHGRRRRGLRLCIRPCCRRFLPRIGGGAQCGSHAVRAGHGYLANCQRPALLVTNDNEDTRNRQDPLFSRSLSSVIMRERTQRRSDG
jgi:hypothetical protein